MEKKTEVVRVRMGDDEKSALFVFARNQGKTVSAVIMELIRKDVLQTQNLRRSGA